MTEGTNVPEDLKYSKDHEWVRVEGGLVVVGITDYAQHSLHEITFVELPETGSSVEADTECGLVESMKACLSTRSHMVRVGCSKSNHPISKPR
nr:MAG: hypothetical protein AM324_16560 [Candidatus Thorarchaeota archaeon SMTZ1-83]